MTMKHPGPWTVDQSGGYIVDANGVDVARVDTPDPETRAILTHAAELWKELREIHECRGNIPACCDLVDKISAEIAAAKGDGT